VHNRAGSKAGRKKERGRRPYYLTKLECTKMDSKHGLKNRADSQRYDKLEVVIPKKLEYVKVVLRKRKMKERWYKRNQCKTTTKKGILEKGG